MADNSKGKSVEELFYEDDFHSVLRRTIDSKIPVPLEELPFAIAALSFLARLDEARILCDHRIFEMPLEARILSRFYLGIAYCRHNQASEARRFLGQNASDRRYTRDHAKSQFFIAQGLGFYRYTYGENRKAIAHVAAAQKWALIGNFIHGRLLADDLKAHVEIHLGDIRQGLSRLEKLSELAEQHGLTNAVLWSSIARLLYQASFGLLTSNAIDEIRSFLGRSRGLDSYSTALLQLEIARQELLAGRADQSKVTLDAASQAIFEVSNPRLEAQLYLRLAAYYDARGEDEAAMKHLDLALSRVQNLADKKLEQRIKGFQFKLRPSPELDAELATLDRRYPMYPGRRILKRHQKQAHSFLIAQDPLGDLIDSCRKSGSPSNVDLNLILANGWYGLLYRLVDEAKGQDLMCLDLGEKGSVTTFSQGNVEHSIKAQTPLARKLILALSQGERSKEDLLKHVWGYTNYSAERHNNLIYNLLTTARKALGSRSDWIQSSDKGYRLKPGVKVLDPESNTPEVPVDQSLSARQTAALKRMKEGDRFSADDYRQWFAVSEATALRDLRELTERQLIGRFGKARSTYYRYASQLDG